MWMIAETDTVTGGGRLRRRPEVDRERASLVPVVLFAD
jgi:hypothetical protein